MAIINPNCPCKNIGCPRHGNCVECKANHHASGGLTSCERLAQEQEEKKNAMTWEEFCMKNFGEIRPNPLG